MTAVRSAGSLLPDGASTARRASVQVGYGPTAGRSTSAVGGCWVIEGLPSSSSSLRPYHLSCNARRPAPSSLLLGCGPGEPVGPRVGPLAPAPPGSAGEDGREHRGPRLRPGPPGRSLKVSAEWPG